MPDRPTALELVEAVKEFLAGEVLPLMDDHRMKFRTLVAMNALGIAYRELASRRRTRGSPRTSCGTWRAGSAPAASPTTRSRC